MSNIDSQANTMHGRTSAGRVQTWLLMSADRRLLAFVFLVMVFTVLVALGTFDVTALRSALQRSDPVETLFQGLVGAIITGVTLVVTISQLVLSQELGALGDQNERMENAMQFRQRAEEELGVPASPPEPSAFLGALADDARDARDGTAAAQVRDFAEDLVENARQVSGRLGRAQFGTFAVVSAALDFNYSWKIYEARRLRNAENTLSDDVRVALDDLVEVLKLFGPSREHVKTLYFEWELIDLSRVIIYSALPALIVSISSIMYLENSALLTGSFFGIDHVTWVVGAAVSVSLSPFMLLLSYILRLVTVAKRTLAMGPFILRETNRSKDIDWDS